jgi:hypothetical protein
MKMRQSIAELERQFVEDAVEDRERQDALRRHASLRTRKRRLDKMHKSGSLRFILLLIILLGTAVLVTVAMFQVLFIVMD